MPQKVFSGNGPPLGLGPQKAQKRLATKRHIKHKTEESRRSRKVGK
jgi:hypothetical protein